MQRYPIIMAMLGALLGVVLVVWPVAGQAPRHAPLHPAPHDLPLSELAIHDAYHSIEGAEHIHAQGGTLPTLPNTPQGCETPTDPPVVQGVTPLAPGGVFCTGISFNAELDIWEMDGRRFVTQAGGSQAAFLITEVTDPTAPVVRKLFTWADDYGVPDAKVYAPSIRYFRQDSRHYLALSLERLREGLFPGILIIDVTNPADPQVLWHLTGELTGSPPDGKVWYDVHNVFVETENGEGTYLWLTNDNNYDVRVIDIRNLASLTPGDTSQWMGREVGRWTHPDEKATLGFMHDITVERGRAYLSYWLAGLVIVPTAPLHSGVFTGTAAADLALHELHAIDPQLPLAPGNRNDFVAHHAWPSPDGRWVFLQDESSIGPESHVQLWDLRALPEVPDRPTAFIELEGQSRTHNLYIKNNRLYVGWYGDGLRAFDLDLDNPAGPQITPTLTHTLRTPPQTAYRGAWGARVGPCDIQGQAATCIYTSDMGYGLMIDREDTPPPCNDADQDCNGQIDVTDVQTVAATWKTKVDLDSLYRPLSDLDADGDVDVRDIQLASRHWEQANR